ncbi:hypothetical protein Daus18300_010755 [Diaporthe australafricana]|uniref:Ankyrin repeat protein n=1 Tax=Diaporthe australafricana TaxID=127596 RepID=A0ABR3W8Z6_9PEZI
MGASLPKRYLNANYQDERPLHLALHNRWTRDAEITCDLLLKHGADINAKSSLGKTALQVACHRGNEEGVRFLLKMGANVDCTAWDGDTAFDSACTAWQPDAGIIQALLTYGTTPEFEYHGLPVLYEIAGRFLNESAAENASGTKDSGEEHDNDEEGDSDEYASVESAVKTMKVGFALWRNSC